ncbi:hypothetical protein F5I97DRAFT_1914437 [Phlebopus sp. FC_14]|nr:hypothetical protein F5I97DRAFT_1914437 [Phlebopus sp. FC_14]
MLFHSERCFILLTCLPPIYALITFFRLTDVFKKLLTSSRNGSCSMLAGTGCSPSPILISFAVINTDQRDRILKGHISP